LAPSRLKPAELSLICGKLNSTDKQKLEGYYCNHDRNTGDRRLGEDILKASPIILELFKKACYMYDDRAACDDSPWYEDLSPDKLVNSWVYFEKFNGKITNIGKNYLFKAMFHHEDTVPEGHKACNNLHNLCPRCRLFGMTAENNDSVFNVKGFKGRFKASTLRHDTPVHESSSDVTIKVGGNHINSCISEWKDGNGMAIAKQFLLPLQGPPKPNKRDIECGYYDHKSGFIQGAKYYLHGIDGVRSLKDFAKYIEGIDNKTNLGTMLYSHELRRYAVLCDMGIEFTGTVGAENCTKEEIAKLIVLLDSELSKHGFKLGLGKDFGLGSVSSKINTIWIRDSKTYTWKQIDICNLAKELDLDIDDLPKQYKHGLNVAMNSDKRSLHFSDPGQKYWDEKKKLLNDRE
ncbi:MAG: hypothetical protein HQK96_21395, partial [Nitrospirae bacterium]|nr:hypothetical protein [Nitrospirota bacterium]